LRDSGPITLRTPDGFRLMDFRFTGWGGKFEASRDDELIERLFEQGLFERAERAPLNFALEGGAIDTDGDGTLLTTWQCLNERHPALDRATLSARLADWLVQDRVLWLDHGYLEGDDTDAHVDTLARFAPGNAIVFQACDDPSDSHYAELRAMGDEIAALRTKDGKPYTLYPLPWAQPIVDDGRASRVVCELPDRRRRRVDPSYGDVADAAAAACCAKRSRPRRGPGARAAR
jgi:agmatine/peptidylarginine deiminase